MPAHLTNGLSDGHKINFQRPTTVQGLTNGNAARYSALADLAYMREQATDMHKQATDMQKQAWDMHAHATDMYKQVRDMNGHAADMRMRATDIEKQGWDLLERARVMHQQATEMHVQATDMHVQVTDMNEQVREQTREMHGLIAQLTGHEKKLDLIKAELKDTKGMNRMVKGVHLPTRLLFLRSYEREVMGRHVPDRGCSYEGDVNDGVGDVRADTQLIACYPDVFTVLDVDAFRRIYGLQQARAFFLSEYVDLCDALSVLGTHASRRRQPEGYERLRTRFLDAMDGATDTQLQCVGHGNQGGVLSSLWHKVMALKPISNAQV
ncbi:MAG: hypothetical protein M1826_004545 [Phylliscum demangeonii]|nr:MAG: hypothetical protein M1826_004545 [Phylliscum demangeonii]